MESEGVNVCRGRKGQAMLGLVGHLKNCGTFKF